MTDNSSESRVERHPTKYPGVFFRIADRIGGNGTEKVYYVSYKKHNKKIETKVGRQFADDMTPARANQLRNDFIEGRALPRAEKKRVEKATKRWTLSDLWDEYKRLNPENKGLKSDDNLFGLRIKPSPIGEMGLDEIAIKHIDNFKNSMSGISPKTVKNTLEIITRLSNFAVKKQICGGLSFKIEYPEINNETTEDLTEEQFMKLIEVLDGHRNPDVKNIMLLAMYSGMRRGEIFKLRWDDVDFQRGIITLKNPKSGRDKVIPMNDLAREVLESCIRHKGEYVFPGRGGGPRKSIQREAQEIRKAAGLPEDFRPMHGLRHFFATSLICSGKVDLADLQKLMTHSSIQMTLRYAKKRDERLAAASNVITEIFKK